MTPNAQTSQAGQFSEPKAVSRSFGAASQEKTTQPPKLLDQLHEALRSRHYSRRTEQRYAHLSSTVARRAFAVRWTVFEVTQGGCYADPDKMQR